MAQRDAHAGDGTASLIDRGNRLLAESNRLLRRLDRLLAGAPGDHPLRRRLEEDPVADGNGR